MVVRVCVTCGAEFKAHGRQRFCAPCGEDNKRRVSREAAQRERERHPEKARERNRKWREAHGEELRERERAYRLERYRGTDPAQLHVERFDGLRSAVLDRDHRLCRLCGAGADFGVRFLTIHHIDGTKDNNVMDNLITLCRGCHPKVHNRYEAKYQELLQELVQAKRPSVEEVLGIAPDWVA